MSKENPSLPDGSTFNRKIFVLGDSRTGTKSLANYFRRNGLHALHYYTNDAQQIAPSHEHHEENWRRLKAFFEESPAQAFSDYPTRLFYRELYEERPDDFFILTTRKDTPTWRRSMERFFGTFKIKLDLDKLAEYYETQNAEICALYGGSRKFLHICIDDDSRENSAKLAAFLGFDPAIMLARENQTAGLDISILSRRGDFFGQPAGDVVEHVKLSCRGSKTMPTSTGWLYLINDSNNFLDYLYGRMEWSAAERERALQILGERTSRIAERGARYTKFIIPEKYVVYPEFLPPLLRDLPFASARPAVHLAEHPNVIYLGDYLFDAKSYGPLYFRTDTHPTWLGAFLVYRRIAEELNKESGGRLGPPLRLESLIPQIAGYDGDLLVQMRDDQRKELAIWGPYLPENFRDHAISYKLKEDSRKARRVETPQEYAEMFDTRETFVYEQSEQARPKAVIFRDSTSDFSVDLLAEHFSRSVFVWKDGQVFDHVLEREKPDFVIHVMAERFVSAYPKQMVVVPRRPASASEAAHPVAVES